MATNGRMGKSNPRKGLTFRTGALVLGGAPSKVFWERLNEHGQSSGAGSNRLRAGKNRDAKVDFRDHLMIPSGS